MTTLTTRTPRPPEAPAAAEPLLKNGDRLSRDEFERRYDRMPGLKKAELIEGVVYMASPVRQRLHSRPHSDLGIWLGYYRVRTVGTDSGDNGSVRLDPDNMPQPDLFLFIDPDCGGQAHISEDDYLEGAPELVVEVASSSVNYDLHDKLNAYCRNGVQEYIVWRVEDAEIDWFRLREGRYERLQPGEGGIFRSETFPGLWLDAPALIDSDLIRMHDVLTQGLASAEHATYVERNRVLLHGEQND